MGLKLNGWNRLYVVAAIMWVGACLFYFYTGYPSDERLRAQTDRAVDARRAAAAVAADDANRQKCRAQLLSDKRTSLSSQDLDDAENVMRIAADSNVPSERRSKAIKNSIWLKGEFLSARETEAVEKCVQVNNKKMSLLEMTLQVVDQQVEMFEQELPKHRAQQKSYLIQVLCISILPLLFVYVVGLATVWIRQGFASTPTK
jgi:hypothetical protein